MTTLEQLRETIRYLRQVAIPYLVSEHRVTQGKLEYARYHQVELANQAMTERRRPSQDENCLRAKAQTDSLTRLSAEQVEVIEQRRKLLQQKEIQLELQLLEQQKVQVRAELAQHQELAQKLRQMATNDNDRQLLLWSAEETIQLTQQKLEALDWEVISFRQLLTSG